MGAKTGLKQAQQRVGNRRLKRVGNGRGTRRKVQCLEYLNQKIVKYSRHSASRSTIFYSGHLVRSVCRAPFYGRKGKNSVQAQSNLPLQRPKGSRILI
eukprot:3051773-Pleurochrysis_carterae.AAC.1